MTIAVRLAVSPGDFMNFRDLAIEYENSLPVDLRHADFARQLESLEEAYAAPNAAFLAELDDVPCGCVALMALDTSTAVMKKMYVRPDYRRRGVARALLDAFLQTSRDRGFTRIVLDTERRRLEAAYRLYASLGFEECEPYGPVDYESPTFMQLHISLMP
jgi:GNAT superfamily N-acetyltransferase